MARPARFALLAALALCGCGPQTASVRLHGVGSSFVAPVMQVWAEEYASKTDDRVTVNYAPNGSSRGIGDVTSRLADFGCADVPMNAGQVKEAQAVGGAVIHVPLVVGAVVPMYNLPQVAEPLTFTADALAGIFLGKVTNWNDPKLRAANPGVGLPDLAIAPVMRTDPSGSSYIFADYLAKVSPECKATLGVSTVPNWPKGVGVSQQKSDGVAGHVARTVGSIGYIELTYALDSKSKYGKVTNAAGKALLADRASIAAAVRSTGTNKPTAEPYSLHELTYNLTDAPGPDAYPIVGMAFAIVYRKMDAAKAGPTVEFLKWATSAEGQALAEKRNFVALPEAVRQAVAARLGQVEAR